MAQSVSVSPGIPHPAGSTPPPARVCEKRDSVPVSVSLDNCAIEIVQSRFSVHIRGALKERRRHFGVFNRFFFYNKLGMPHAILSY